LYPDQKRLNHCQLISLTVKKAYLDQLLPGDIIRFKTKLKTIKNYNTPAAFNRILWWQQKDIKISAYCNNPINITILGRLHPTLLKTIDPRIWPITLEYLRFKLLNRIKKGFSYESFPLASALLLGIKDSIPDTVREVFSELGIGHLLAISGLHMALIGFFFASILYLVLLFIPSASYYMNIRKVTCITTLIFLFLYCALTGFSPSASRAFIMILVFSIAYLLDMSNDNSLNTLAIAAWVILLLNPLSIFSISFQLSFIAVLFLVLVWKIIVKDINIKNKFYKIFFEFLLANIVAFIATLPLIAFYFNKISIVSILGNIIFVPIFSLMILPGLILSIFILLISHNLALYLWRELSHIIDFQVNIMHLITQKINCAIWVIPPSIFNIAIYYTILTSILLLWIYKIKWKKLILLLGTIFCILTIFIPKLHKFNGIKFYILDVGQGLCQVLEIPKQNKIIVIDAGPSFPDGFNTGDTVIAPFLRKIGYKKIDILICSHPERDHIGGVSALIKNFDIKKLYYPLIKSKSLCWQQTLNLISKKGIKTIHVYKDINLNIEKTTIKILPYTNKNLKGISKNERCLVTEIMYKDKKILLCADINKKRELSLLKRKKIPYNVDVVVVPHHGSLSSSSTQFLKTIRPHIAIFSVGFKNSLHLPAQKILDKYKKIGASIYRTDKNGTICISISNTGKLDISCFKNI